VSVSNISTATAVSAGSAHTCALLSAGTVKCWGEGFRSQLGNGSTSQQNTPVSVSNISTATAVTTHEYHTCALLSGGTVKCWGEGGAGRLGNGNTSDNQDTPVSVSNISTATAISAGFRHTCAVLENKSIQCWGNGSWSELGNGSTSNQSTPVYVVGFGG
jgi:alpha-tubulin suppressor-like RCC1 family protein